MASIREAPSLPCHWEAPVTPSPIRLCDQAWRHLNPAFQAPTFNAPLDVLTTNLGRNTIIFIHVGKCAGESIIKGIAREFGGSVALFQYHSFDANLLIRDLFSAGPQRLPASQHLAILIATRDPLQRWFSAFNWDLHDLHLSQSTTPSPGYLRFPKASLLAEAVASGHPEALAFARTNHMGMGLAWYLPRDLVAALPPHRVYEIRQERAAEDFQHFLADFSKSTGFNLRRQVKQWLHGIRRGPPLPRTKDQYKLNYPPGTFSGPGDCDETTLQGLRAFLADDYAVGQALRRITIQPAP